MENKDDIKNEIKISKTEEEETKEEKDLGKQNNSYSKLANLSRIDNDPNDSNDIEIDSFEMASKLPKNFDDITENKNSWINSLLNKIIK